MLLQKYTHTSSCLAQAKALGMVDQVVDKSQVLEAAEKVMTQLVKVNLNKDRFLCMNGMHDSYCLNEKLKVGCF